MEGTVNTDDCGVSIEYDCGMMEGADQRRVAATQKITNFTRSTNNDRPSPSTNRTMSMSKG